MTTTELDTFTMYDVSILFKNQHHVVEPILDRPQVHQLNRMELKRFVQSKRCTLASQTSPRRVHLESLKVVLMDVFNDVPA